VYVRVVATTTLDDIMADSGVSKSQLYHRFPDKDALIREVIDRQSNRQLARQQERLENVDWLRGLERWRDALVENDELRNGAYGCPVGSLASELADQPGLPALPWRRASRPGTSPPMRIAFDMAIERIRDYAV
jgi:AcrR family transcriptional regulator